MENAKLDERSLGMKYPFLYGKYEKSSSLIDVLGTQCFTSQTKLSK